MYISFWKVVHFVFAIILAKEIPVKYIAQYLNISRETLSRIRAKYAKD